MSTDSTTVNRCPPCRSAGSRRNVVPDACTVAVNYRFAPSKSAAEAEGFLREFFTGFDVVVTDAAEGARPGLDRAIAQTSSTRLGSHRHRSWVGPMFRGSAHSVSRR